MSAGVLGKIPQRHRRTWKRPWPQGDVWTVSITVICIQAKHSSSTIWLLEPLQPHTERSGEWYTVYELYQYGSVYAVRMGVDGEILDRIWSWSGLSLLLLDDGVLLVSANSDLQKQPGWISPLSTSKSEAVVLGGFDACLRLLCCR